MSIPLLIPKAHASRQYDGSSICDYSMARLVLNSVFNSLQPSFTFLYPLKKSRKSVSKFSALKWFLLFGDLYNGEGSLEANKTSKKH